MSYTVIFRDKTSVMVDNRRGEKLKQLVLENKEPGTPLDINGELYRLYDIVRVRKGKPETERYHPPERQIGSGKLCHGSNSIQHHINDLIKSDYPDWAKRIRDTRFREELRQQLRDVRPDGWCDYRARECAC